MKKISYDDLTSRCKELQKKAKEENNLTNQKLYDAIFTMLTQSNIFKQMSCQMCLNILIDLKYSSEDAQKIYKQLF